MLQNAAKIGNFSAKNEAYKEKGRSEFLSLRP